MSGSRFYTGTGSQFQYGGPGSQLNGSRFHPTPGTSRFSTASMRRGRKWAKTRMFLHIIHWITFIAINIPGFVNVGLVPVWYNPVPTTNPVDGAGANTGINSPHRLAGLCTWSPDVIWAGRAFPPSYPPPCAHTVSYKAWLWGAIGRVLVTFFVAGLWIVVDGVWWGAWVVGTRNVGWRGAVGRPWTPASIRRKQQQRRQRAEEKVEHIDEGDGTGESENEHGKRESAFVRRIRLLSAASRASGKSGRSSKSHHTKEKPGESSEGERPPPLPKTTHAYASAQESATPVGSGTDVEDEIASPMTKTAAKHRVRRKPVRPISFPAPDSTPSSPLTTANKDIYSLASERSSQEKPRLTYYPPMPMPGGGIGSRRPSAQESIGGSTVVGSPLGGKHFSASFEPFNPGSPPSTAQSPVEERGRRSIGLDIVPEHQPDRDAAEEEEEERGMREYPERPQSRLARYYDDDMPPLVPYRDGARAPSPPSPTTVSAPGRTTNPNAFSPVVSPGADAPLLTRGYFLVGDGGFSNGEVNEGAYDEESYYSAVSNGAGGNGADRSTTPLSDRSASPSSYGHALNPEDRQDTESPVEERRYTSRSQYLSPSSNQQQQQRAVPYQHPLAQGIQLAMGRPPETYEREVRMLGGVVRRMSTIESFGSHERELSRRGSAATARTNMTTTRGNSGGVGRENTNGSGNSAGLGGGSLPSPHTPVHGSGSGGQMERSSEGEAVGAIVRSNSPTDIPTPP